jgi:hypothetical protein
MTMKIGKGLALFLLLCGVFSSCFDPPEFPRVPSIEYWKTEFVDAATDSLIVYINFKDGDGDLGLDSEDPNYINYPYNNTFFFQEHNGGFDTLYSTITQTQGPNQVPYEILNIPNAANGKLVFPRTRKKPGYGSLPPYNCIYYEYLLARNLLIKQSDYPALDKTVRITDTIKSQSGQFYYQIQDTLLVSTNPNHYNIEIDFLIKRGKDDFVEYDFKKESQNCGVQSYDGRFPFLTEKPGRALQGTLRYSMNSAFFLNVFSIKTLKLRIQIKDRALHRSNIVETQEFTLDKIRKG